VTDYDVVLRGGMVYDGRGGDPFSGDVAIVGDSIADLGLNLAGRGQTEIDAAGQAVAPGFINMLSWAVEPLVVDGRSQSDIRQGVTLEVFGEGLSVGPLNDDMKRFLRERQTDIQYDISWTTLDEGLRFLTGEPAPDAGRQVAASERPRGISCNVASFVGATTLRIHEIGYEDRPPTTDELTRMQSLARQAMAEGALGIGSSLIYAPACYAGTDELVALATIAATHGGMYISHIRNEGGRLLEAVEELLTIARRSGGPAEIWHFKAAGKGNWPKFDGAIERVQAAQANGLRVSADVYPYSASSTGLDATMPGWVQEGGHAAWVARLKDPLVRERMRTELATARNTQGNEFVGAEKILLVGFRSEALRPLAGKTLAEVAQLRGTSVEDTIMDLVVEDDSRVQSIFFTMSEANVRKAVALRWVAFCSDAGSLAPEGVFLNTSTHPRAYGSFARLLGKYVRGEGVISLQEAIRRLTSFPADNLGLQRRGRLTTGHYADVVVFDPAVIQDHATFEQPHQYATGVEQVLVNGVQVLRDGEHTGALPGRVVRGPGYAGLR
jgi:N-acyl-D-amino-acid deacylase